MEAEVLWYSLIYAAEEMGVVLQRTAVSPNIRDRLDFSCAVLDPSGLLVAQAEHIPVHLGSMAVAARSVVSEVYRVYGEPRPGDVYAINDPYLAGTHLNDVMVLAPVFHGGELVAWVASKAHHVDLGGRVPGGIGGDAASLYDEGTVIPLVRIVRGGEWCVDVLRLLEANSRTPELLRLDLHAQVASLEHGSRLVAEQVARLGAARFTELLGEVISYVEDYTRRLVEPLEGEAEAVDVVEGALGDYTVRARVSFSRGSVVVDFAGSSPQAAEPVNAVYGVTVAATTFALKSVLDPSMPVNEGFMRVVEVRAPEGSIVNPRKPAPVGAGNTETSQRIVDVIHRALAELLPGRVPAASGGTMTSVSLGGQGWAFYETVATGTGGRPGRDGVDGVHVNMTNTLNTPIEVLESTHPVMILEYRLRSGSCGLGEYRGGLGVVRRYRALERITASVAGSRVRSRPWGLAGGWDGAPARYYVVRRSGSVVELEPIARIELEPGDELVVETPGGGGYGDPCARSREALERDLREGRITVEQFEELARRCGWR